MSVPGRYWNFAFGAAFVLLHRPFPMRGIPALQSMSLSPDPPSGLSFAIIVGLIEQVDSELAGQARLVNRSVPGRFMPHQAAVRQFRLGEISGSSPRNHR